MEAAKEYQSKTEVFDIRMMEFVVNFSFSHLIFHLLTQNILSFFFHLSSIIYHLSSFSFTSLKPTFISHLSHSSFQSSFLSSYSHQFLFIWMKFPILSIYFLGLGQKDYSFYNPLFYQVYYDDFMDDFE